MENDFSFKGRNVLITGATKRIGRALAIAFAKEGANVIIHHRESQTAKDDFNSLSEKIRKLYPIEIRELTADLSSEKHVINMMDDIRSRDISIDVLINNASIFRTSHLMNIEEDELLESVKINANAPLLISRLFLKMVQNEKSRQERNPSYSFPCIINMLDARVNEIGDYDKKHAAYHLSKNMLLTITKMLALELAPIVRVNAIAPGLILPPEGEGVEYLEALKEKVPLKRIGSLEHLSNAVMFLTKNDYITGQVIYIDGGRHLRSEPDLN